MSRLRGILLCFFCVILNIINCFNIDTKYPIIYVDRGLDTPGNGRGSYFGYSVALYPGNDPENSWIQISAPRKNNSDLNSIEPGGIYQCPIYGPCDVFHVDSAYFPRSDLKISHDRSWSGMTMDVDPNSKRIVTCSPLLKTTLSTQIYPMGACYWTEVNRISKNETFSNAFMPFRDKNLRSYNGVVFYSFGQLGMSMHMIEGKNNKQELLLGAPGFYNWKGNVVLYRDGVPNELASNKRSVETNEEDYSENIIPNMEYIDYFRSYAYFGYSVTAGRFYSRTLRYVGSAPKANKLRGLVVIFNFPPYSPHHNQHIFIHEIKFGDHIGEYFGASLTVADINGDGLDDLIVGSPHYFSKNKYDLGRVQVYVGDKKMNKLVEPAENKEIQGKVSGGQFGLAIQTLGDIDADGYDDLAIGAYKSGHAVLLRSHPVVDILCSVKPWNIKKLERTSKSFDIEVCVWFKGKYLPKKIDINYNVKVDDFNKRAYIKNENTTIQQHIVTADFACLKNKYSCANLTINIKNSITEFFDPIDIEVTPSLTNKRTGDGHITFVRGSTRQVDPGFRKNYPVTRTVPKSAKINVPFALACGDDGICTSDLHVTQKFTSLESSDSVFILGIPKLLLEIEVSNSEEPAYDSKLHLQFPSTIILAKNPTYCEFINTNEKTDDSTNIMCNIGNPLENTTMHIPLTFDMTQIETSLAGVLNFKVNVTTVSEDIQPEDNAVLFSLISHSDAEVKISGKSIEGDTNATSVEITHKYEVRKSGKSGIKELEVKFLVPYKINTTDGETIKFLNVSIPKSRGALFSCISSEAFTASETSDTSKLDSEVQTMEVDDQDDQKMKRAVDETIKVNEMANRTEFFNCSREGVDCMIITCTSMHPFRGSDSATFELDMVLNVTLIEPILGEHDLISFATEGQVRDPDVYSRKANYQVTSSMVVGQLKKGVVDTWIIIISVVSGVLLLVLVILGLIKAGFFQRTKKAELELLRNEKVVSEEFIVCEQEPEK